MILNTELARHNMIEQQIRPWEVLDRRVLDVLTQVPRENYVPTEYKNMAFADINLPLGNGEVMMKPIVEGRMLQALELNAGDQVLEIGTGSGFITACLSRLASYVHSLEIREELAESAKKRLRKAGFPNIRIETTDAIQEFYSDKRFDAVVLTGVVYSLPENIRSWVKPGGRLFAIQGESPVMHAVLHRRLSESEWREEWLFETDLPYLRHAEPPKFFIL